jgi:hypothetical protein
LDVCRFGRAFARCAIAAFGLALFAHDTVLAQVPNAGAALPPAIMAMRSFRGRIDYVVRRDGTTGGSVSGTLVIRDDSWQLDERTPGYELRADAGSAAMVAGGDPIQVDDLLNADPLANAWAAVFGMAATQPVAQGPADRVWVIGDVRFFLDPSGARVSAFAEAEGAQVAYTLDAWSSAGSLIVPGRILRLRNGVPDAAFSVSGYRVTPAFAPAAVPKTDAFYAPDRVVGSHPNRFVVAPVDVRIDWLASCAAALACLLVGALAAVAWSRRDALLLALCKRMARDPRGWGRAGVSIYVEADGLMVFDGMRYRVGPHFYARAALVQQSALFLRVSAPAVSTVVILPRKFRPIDLGIRPSGRRTPAAGFTLVETLVATALFAAVVLLVVYPAIVAVARSNDLAAQHLEAAVVAADALGDEESVAEYDGGAPLGTTTTAVDGMTLTVTVSPGTIPDERDLDVKVTTAGGTELAHVASWLGVAVKSPPNSSGGPPP